MPFGIRLTDVLDWRQTFLSIKNPWAGYWLHAYDPDAHEGFGEAKFLPEPGGALRFDSIDEAKAFWWQQSTVLPVRDGKENRPLTVCSIDIDEI